MPQITEPRTTDIVARYVAAWSEPDPGSRRAAIAGLWAPDGAEFVEGTQFRGHQELDARITHAYQEFVASGRYAVSSASDVTRHDGVVTFTIQLTAPGGDVAWAARVFLVLGRDGRIREDYQLTAGLDRVHRFGLGPVEQLQRRPPRLEHHDPPGGRTPVRDLLQPQRIPVERHRPVEVLHRQRHPQLRHIAHSPFSNPPPEPASVAARDRRTAY